MDEPDIKEVKCVAIDCYHNLDDRPSTCNLKRIVIEANFTCGSYLNIQNVILSDEENFHQLKGE
jgi:hypothetical protein